MRTLPRHWEIVAFAAARHIQVVPEIDVPGHATAAIAAPDEEENASTVIRGTAAALHGAMSSAARHPHISVEPPTYHSRLVKQASTIGAQTNSSVNASVEAAIMPAT